MTTQPEVCPYSFQDSMMIAVAIWSTKATYNKLTAFHCTMQTTDILHRPNSTVPFYSKTVFNPVALSEDHCKQMQSTNKDRDEYVLTKLNSTTYGTRNLFKVTDTQVQSNTSWGLRNFNFYITNVHLEYDSYSGYIRSSDLPDLDANCQLNKKSCRTSRGINIRKTTQGNSKNCTSVRRIESYCYISPTNSCAQISQLVSPTITSL